MDIEKLVEVLEELENEENIDRVLNEILTEINRITDKISDVAENNRIYNFEHGSISVKLVKYRFGSGYVHRYMVYINGRTVPEKAGSLGDGYHPFGNFDNYERHIDIDDIYTFVDEIEDFISAFKAHVEARRAGLEKLKTIVSQVEIQ